jgi:NAD(P)H-dependent flavin oxidoreductase YrpB (nitropropane dioxygenase family)
MRTAVCDLLEIEYPIFAFTRSPQVAAEVSKAGGMGVLGGVAFGTEELREALAWMDEHVDGKPYGLDVVMPAVYEGAGIDAAQLEAMIPAAQRNYVEQVLDRHGVPKLPDGVDAHEGLLAWTHDKAREQVNIGLEHPIRLIANALGSPPADVIESAHQRGVLVAALAGSKNHARHHVDAGVDIIVAQGTEAGGHTGDVSTMVLVPEIVEEVRPKPVLAAGGIGSGAQMAAALALGAEGVWTGSIWLAATEAETQEAIVEKMLSATSRDTVRSRALTGKPARQLRTAWTDAWDGPESPGTLQLPLQFMLTVDAVARIHRYADQGVDGARELIGTPVGQIVGSMAKVRPAGEIVRTLVSEFDQASERLANLTK